MYQENEKKVASSIRASYEDRGQNKVELLKKLDKKAKLPAEIFSYIFGIVGSLVLGVGMCLAMKIIGNLIPLGIVVGNIGIAMIAVNYVIYKKLATNGKKKYANAIIQLSDEVLGN